MPLKDKFVMRGKPLQVMVLLTAGVAFLLFGYDQGVMGGLVGLEAFQNRFQNPDPALLGFMVASYDIGCFMGAVAAFLWGDKTGRRWAIIYGCIVASIGAALQTSAFSRTHYIIGRIVAGLGVGAISVTVPIYISECVDHKKRGALVVTEITIIITGIATSNFTNLGFVWHRPELNGTDAQWRIPLGLQLIFPPFVFLLIPFTIESPRWLASKGRYEEVAEVLAQWHGGDATPQSDNIQQAAQSIIAVAMHEAELDTSWKELFTTGELQNFRRFILAGSTGFLHQATGINVVIYYAPSLFAQAGLSGRMSYIMSCVGSVAFLVGSALPIAYVETIGRRKTMMLGSWLCASCMSIIAITGAISKYYPSRSHACGWAGAAFIIIFQFCFGVGWNSMNWLYGSEIGSLRMRNRTSATQCFMHWITNFLTVMVSPLGFDRMGWSYYLIWAAITFAGIPYLWLCFPETAGRTLEQMDDFFSTYPQWNIGKVANVDLEPAHLASEVETKKQAVSEHAEKTSA